MRSTKSLMVALVAVAALVLNSCGGGSIITPVTNNSSSRGTIFVVGTDAPLPSVLAFKVTFTGLTASDGTNTVSLLPQSQDVEFARLNGLRTLLALNSVPAGTYTSVTATLAAPVISYLDISSSPPSVQTLNGTLTQSGVTVQLRQPIVVTDGGLVGLHLDFPLRLSLEVDGSGQLTGNVNPHLFIRAVPPDAPDAHIDELRGGVVSVNAAAGSFVMQGPHGRQITVIVDSQTNFSAGDSLNTLDTNTIVEVSGSLQRISLSLRATDVHVISRDRFLVSGLLTDVRPAAGPANDFDLLVRGEIPDLPNVQVGRISTIGLDGNERFGIHHFQHALQNFLFNRGSMVAGQRISVGGALVTTTNPPTLDARHVVLHRQGVDGILLPGGTIVQTGNNGRFIMRAMGITGMLFGRPVRVFTSDRTRFINLSGLADLAGTTPLPLRVVGLVLLDHATGEQVVIAFAVEQMQ